MINRELLFASVALASLLTDCTDSAAPRGSITPEALTVAFQPSPDTISGSGPLSVSATARNATNHVVYGQWQSGACGLTVIAYQPSGDVFLTAPIVCRGSGSWTLAPGDSTVTTLFLSLSGQPRGTYRVRAQVFAVNGNSLPVERSIIVR